MGVIILFFAMDCTAAAATASAFDESALYCDEHVELHVGDEDAVVDEEKINAFLQAVWEARLNLFGASDVRVCAWFE